MRVFQPAYVHRSSISVPGGGGVLHKVATLDWDFEFGGTNPEVIFTRSEGIGNSINMQEDEEDPSLISDAESVIKGPLIIEISNDSSNLGEEHSREILFGGTWWHPSWRRTGIYMMKILTIGIVVTPNI